MVVIQYPENGDLSHKEIASIHLSIPLKDPLPVGDKNVLCVVLMADGAYVVYLDNQEHPEKIEIWDDYGIRRVD